MKPSAHARRSCVLAGAVASTLLAAIPIGVPAEEALEEPCAEENAEVLASDPIEVAGRVAGFDPGAADAAKRTVPSDAAAEGDGEGADEGADESSDEASDQIDTPAPERWEASKGKQCRRYRRRRFCEGPRKVPLPYGEAAERAKALGLGTQRAASLIGRGPPPREWVEAVTGVAELTLRWPVDEGRLWRGFGPAVNRGRRRIHKGVDIGAPAGSPVRAVNDGLVVYSDNGVRGYGNLVMVVHADASVAFYAHNSANLVFAGQDVGRGQAVAEVGQTGLAQGDHLHFELRIDGEAVDPMPRFVDIPESALRRRGSPSR